MSEYYTKLLRENNLEELNKNAIPPNTYFLQLCCSTCQNTYIIEGCCSQSGIKPIQPYTVLTSEEVDNLCDINSLDCPFDFMCLSFYVEMILS